MKENETIRLYLKAVDIEDAPFILKLLNTPKWIRFIGDRNVIDLAGSIEYIQTRMLPQMEECGFGNYVLVRKEDGAKMGTCGLFKRESLDGVDIGFAMLPDYEGKGYSSEAATFKSLKHQHIFESKRGETIMTTILILSKALNGSGSQH